MPQQSPTHQHSHRPRWLLSGVVGMVIFLLALSALPLQSEPESTNDYTQAQLQEQLLGVRHDELIMLTISLVVIIQIVTSYKMLKWVPYRGLLFGSFGALALSAVCTVVESMAFKEVFNLLEHLAFMMSSILLVIWCGFIFGSEKREAV